jgi:hypothetical protein
MGENKMANSISVILKILIATSLAGCASKAENIAAAYVSPLQYQSYSCSQLGEEAARIATRANQVAGVQDGKATNDAVATGVGVIIFWPALFLIKGDSTTAAELARLKGEIEAIEKVATQKKCNIQFNQKTT